LPELAIAESRRQFARPRAQVEEDIRKWHAPVERDPNAPPPPPETKKFPLGMRPPVSSPAISPLTSRPYTPRPPLGVVPPPLPRPLVGAPAPLQKVVPPQMPVVGAPAAVHRPFASALKESAETPTTAPSPQEQKETSKEHPVSLSTLKITPKKDKGPSAENLSSLKAVLEAAMVGKSSEESSAPIVPVQKIPTAQTPPPPLSKPTPPPLLTPIPEPVKQKEVPEHVLKNLLAD